MHARDSWLATVNLGTPRYPGGINCFFMEAIVFPLSFSFVYINRISCHDISYFDCLEQPSATVHACYCS